jgi:hypothetical protein
VVGKGREPYKSAYGTFLSEVLLCESSSAEQTKKTIETPVEHLSI